MIGSVVRAESLSIMLCKELLAYHINDEAAAHDIAVRLNATYPSHSYPILLKEAQRIGLKARQMPEDLAGMLIELNVLYSEMGQKATTDFSEVKAHGNEIIKIIEGRDRQIFYQNDHDWFYRTEERRWITMNDNSSWRSNSASASAIVQDIFHIA